MIRWMIFFWLFVFSVTTVQAEHFNLDGSLQRTGVSSPGLDIYHVRCDQATRIAAILDVPQNRLVPRSERQAYHLTTVCVAPPSRQGRADKETADGTIWPNTEITEVRECREALILVQCDFHNPACDFTYALVGICTNAALLPGWELPVTDH